MSDTGMNAGFAVERFVVEIDGAKHSEHACFVDAIKTGLLLREQHPESKIAVRDLSESKSEEVASGMAA